MQERKGGYWLLYCNKETGKFERVKKIVADGGYSGEKFAEGIEDMLGAKVEIVKRNDLHNSPASKTLDSREKFWLAGQMQTALEKL